MECNEPVCLRVRDHVNLCSLVLDRYIAVVKTHKILDSHEASPRHSNGFL